MKPKYLLRLLSFLLTFSLALTLIAPVYATDSIDSLEQSSSNLEEELSDLKSEMEVLSAEISSITGQIIEITEEIKQTKEELALAKGQEEVQYESMKQRIRYMYENGNNSLLEMLFSSASLAEFLKRAEFCSAISEYDQAQLEKLAETRESIVQKEEKLAREQENLYALQEKLNEKETVLTQQISSTSSELAAITEQLNAAREEVQNAQDELNQEVVPVLPPEPEPSSPSQDENNAGNDNTSSDDNDSSNDSDSSNDNDSDISVSASDIELFAALIECEAGSTDYEGMLAVASVVVNRMNHSSYPDTLRGVIYQAGQFPPAHNGSVDRILKRGVKDSCIQAANDALAGKNNVGDCLSFRSASSGHVGTIIGDNVFF